MPRDMVFRHPHCRLLHPLSRTPAIRHVHTDDVCDRVNKDLAVPDLAGERGAGNLPDDRVHLGPGSRLLWERVWNEMLAEKEGAFKRSVGMLAPDTGIFW